MNTENPFLSKDFYVDWRQLTPDKIVPDITLALARAKKNLDEICALKNCPEKITFDSAVLGFSRATRELGTAWTRVCHLESVENTPEFRRAYNEVLPKVSEFFGGIFLNDELKNVIDIAAKKTPAATLTATQARFLEETLADFRDNGANLPADKKARLNEINTRLSATTAKFAENVLDSTNAWEKFVEDEGLLAGVPESAKLAARDSARKKGRDNAWRFTLQAPSLSPIMQYAENDDLRREFWEAGNAVARGGEFDNTPVLREILALRDEKAKLLGFANFADYTTSRRMAKSGGNALKFVETMQARIASFFANENAELEQFAREHGEATSKKFGKIAPWARGFVAEKMRKERYDFDEELLRPYFPVESVIAGAFAIASRLYGIEIVEKTGVPVWHDDVKVYEVFDGGKMLGAFYADWHPRETKRSGAWMNALATRGEDAPAHLGLICGNLTPSVAGKPALLNFDEVVTIFHEFGHLLHHVLSDVEIPDLAGTNVAWDFVELPSQIMENWCRNSESLALFARHFETGEALSDELVKKLLRAEKFRAASAAMRQLSFGKMDLDFHIDTEKYRDCDLEKYWNETIANYQIPSPVPQISMARKFLHLFSDPTGYAAGYYSYKWAEMLEADCFTRFEKEGVLNPKTGRDFREKILARGNSAPAEELFRDFMGRDPDITPLLARDGLA
ncbi:MAG: M3 family metallopeptidase [Opitutae bacterium]|nr:M3 family metallopeptidase [Opitutae bacterium]MCD8298501.1 M3 family metallopeptidase [Opitutae bacterium]